MNSTCARDQEAGGARARGSESNRGGAGAELQWKEELMQLQKKATPRLDEGAHQQVVASLKDS